MAYVAGQVQDEIANAYHVRVRTMPELCIVHQSNTMVDPFLSFTQPAHRLVDHLHGQGIALHGPKIERRPPNEERRSEVSGRPGYAAFFAAVLSAAAAPL